MDKDELLKKNELFQKYVNERISEESRKAELLVVRSFKKIVPAFMLVPIGYIVTDYLHNRPIHLFYWILLAYMLVVIVYHRFVEWLLKRIGDSYVIRFVNVSIEITTISFVIYTMYKVFGAVAILSGPLIMVYMIMIVMTGFRYSFRLSLFSGIMAAFQHLLLYSFFIWEVPQELYDTYLDFGPSGIIQKSVYLLFTGIISSLLALYQKLMIMKVAVKSIEISEIKDTFGQYVSREIRDFILSGNVDINGEEIEGVILFTDLVNFNEYLSAADPKNVVIHLNEYFTEMVKIISDHKGVVNKFIGDTIMAVFGLSDDDNPELSAVQCAALMQERLDSLNYRWKAVNDYNFDMGIGIASGKFITGNIGSEDRKEFTCIGDVVNTASRLEGVGRMYERGIVVSENVRNKIDAYFYETLSDIGFIKLKGKINEVKAYLVSIDSFIELNRKYIRKKIKKS